MSWRIVVIFVTLSVLAGINVKQAKGTYDYEVTVDDSGGQDFTTINDAIADVIANTSTGDTSCIWVYPGDYIEQLRDPYMVTYENETYGPYNVGCHNLPEKCDLRRAQGQTSNVNIHHAAFADENVPSWKHIHEHGITCNGDNLLENLRILNPGDSGGEAQESILIAGWGSSGEVRNCTIKNYHASGIYKYTGSLIVENCTVETSFGSCIYLWNCDDFTISDSTLIPFIREWHMENPCGIAVQQSSGTIEDTNITSKNWERNSTDAKGSENNEGWPNAGVSGIRLQLNQNDEVYISNVNITLKLKSIYQSDALFPLNVCGIMSGYSGSYPGTTIVDDCTIVLKGDEEILGGNYGKGVKVNGVLVEGGAEVELNDTSIITEWTPNGQNEDGDENLLCAENGTITVNRSTCNFNPNGSSSPERFDTDYVKINLTYGELINEWETEYVVRNSNGEGVAWFDKYGNLGLVGEITDGQSTISSAPAGSFILKDSSADIVAYISSSGDMVLTGSWSESNGACSPGSDAFIIKPSYSNVGYIDFNGNLCLKKLLHQNDYPIE